MVRPGDSCLSVLELELADVPRDGGELDGKCVDALLEGWFVIASRFGRQDLGVHCAAHTNPYRYRWPSAYMSVGTGRKERQWQCGAAAGVPLAHDKLHTESGGKAHNRQLKSKY